MLLQSLCRRRIVFLEQKILNSSHVVCKTTHRHLFTCTDCSALRILPKNVNNTFRLSPVSPLFKITRVISSSNGDSGKNAKIKAKEVPEIPPAVTPRFRLKYVEKNRALNDYLLTPKDLGTLSAIKTRSAYVLGGTDEVYIRKDIEELVKSKFGSLEKLEEERVRRDESEEPIDLIQSQKHPVKGSTFVVKIALLMNAAITCVKFVAYLYTGSSSMFSETIHSLFDTINQVPPCGVHQYWMLGTSAVVYFALMWASVYSARKPDSKYPYGYSKFRHLVAIMSGFYLFGVGSALSIGYGVYGLFHLSHLENAALGYGVLGFSFVCESVSFMVAFDKMRKESKAKGMTYKDYLWKGNDPIVTMILFEDGAAILGAPIAAGCMYLSSTYFLAADPLGSLLIGGVLAGVAAAVFKINVKCIDERAIPRKELEGIRSFLEDDRMIRSIHDAKATELDGDIKFKGEVYYDSLEVTRDYLRTLDKQQMLKEIETIKTEEDLDKFMLKHGEQIVDNVGSQTDRIEKNLQKKFPRVRHIDLEAL
ncbi:hypothetical protein LOTGIDRAFT_234506 [Lottia gigantea]|uniref:Cation efflux protein transmembrane domain-containing protein n=1 Tax=Lottia gigantea TaxID=225164 RepID=V3ZBM3_LOTGI|nr:hypothetical protein LOTGIDRAFT_234506 [Lottia gigantea]ESO88418.1 hypothetical protein LOTGIDRAFT_234506 [Lottia gigantea]